MGVRSGIGGVATTTVLDLLAEAATGTGVCRFEPSGVEKSLGAMWQDAEQVARWLRARTGTGGRIGAFLTNTENCPAVVIGTWLSGNDLVSLPYPGRGADLESFIRQIELMCELSGVQLLLLDDAYRGLLPPMSVPTAAFGEAVAGAGSEALPDLPTFSPAGAGAEAGGGGLVQFTSGSLGNPKGVVLTGQALAVNIIDILDAIEVGPGDRAGSWLPLSHDMGFVGMFLACLAANAPRVGGDMLVLQTPESFLADPASWLRLCATHGVTHTTGPNFAFELSVKAAPMLAGLDLSRLRVCITGAERVKADTVARFTETFAPMGLSPEVICPAYGMAEASLAVTISRPADVWRTSVRPGTETLAGGPVLDVGNGSLLERVDLRIVDDAGRPTDGVGDVQIRGASLFSDYLGAERRLTPEGWFPTRDVGYLADGELFLVGRADESIIVGGRNLYSTDIEQAVRHDAVRAGCLAALPTLDGYGLVAEPVRAASADGDLTRLRAICRELASDAARQFGARPEFVGFVERGQLMKTPSGKLRRLSMVAALDAGELPLIASIGR
ncbi:AMP-binding protein [Spongisporangium articulatum]|uniref:AMP-binding protein n=1 Tax=Spongisporangium articulatum TaxID=3362603 RepID=A0ABW8AMM1_9ACTN